MTKVREELLIALHLTIGLLTQNYSLKESWIWLEMLFSCEVFKLLLLHGIIQLKLKFFFESLYVGSGQWVHYASVCSKIIL